MSDLNWLQRAGLRLWFSPWPCAAGGLVFGDGGWPVHHGSVAVLNFIAAVACWLEFWSRGRKRWGKP